MFVFALLYMRYVEGRVMVRRQILDAIEKNGFDNFNQRAYVRKWRKYASLPAAFVKARFG